VVRFLRRFFTCHLRKGKRVGWHAYIGRMFRRWDLRASVLGEHACVVCVAQGQRGGGMRVLGMFENGREKDQLSF